MNKIKKNKGFTLVEIMVATFIFMIIMLAAIGALVSTSNGAKKAKALRAAMDNVNYAMDNMSRSLRLGTNYTCISGSSASLPYSGFRFNCPSGVSTIAFTPVFHTPGQIDTSFERSLLGEIQKCTSTPSYNCVSLTAPEVEITDLQFYVNGSLDTDTEQPSVFMRLKGNVTINGDVTSFSLQNYISQRNEE